MISPADVMVVVLMGGLGTRLKELGLHICINDIWNRMISNSKRNIYTWFYIDEFHVLLESEKTVLFLKKICSSYIIAYL